jgi:hypothetical protein
VTDSPRKNGNRRRRATAGIIITILGFFIFLLGASPELFGLDRSPVIGFVQITVFLVGLGIICVGGYISLNAMWNNNSKTISADIGLRLIATGYVVAVASGLADVFGFGSQPWPQIPSFGRWQSRGVLLGEIIIAVGFLLLLPPGSPKKD